MCASKLEVLLCDCVLKNRCCRGEQVLVIYDELKKVLDARLGEKV